MKRISLLPDRAAKRTADLENAQLSLGKALVPIKEEFTDIYGQIQIGVINAITYIVKHRDTLMILVKAVGLLTATYLFLYCCTENCPLVESPCDCR